MPGKKGANILPPTVRQQIKDYVAERRKNDPAVLKAVVHAEVLKKFGVEISSANFGITYWGEPGPAAPSKSSSNGKPASPAPAPAPPAGAPRARNQVAAGRPATTPSGNVLVRIEFVASPKDAALFSQYVARGLAAIHPTT
jgi:hypothetical protein